MTKAAQAGGGDPKVVAHPAFRDIPACLFPLGTAEARKEYDTLARLLFDAGRMTLAHHRSLSSYAMQFDAIQRAAAAGDKIRGVAFVTMDKVRKELPLDDISKPIAASREAPVNRFALCGFSSRGRRAV